MEILVASAQAEGATELSAFDNALLQLGVGDQNLIHLSSVIPLNANLKRSTMALNGNRQGDRVYCVYAEKRTSCPGEPIAAGLGWVCTKDDSPWGLFVEHVGANKEEVQDLLDKSLQEMMANRPDFDWGTPESEIVEKRCTHKPTCVIAFAGYQCVIW